MCPRLPMCVLFGAEAFEFYVFIVACRNALWSEWPYISMNSRLAGGGL